MVLPGLIDRAVVVLWASGQFDTANIGDLLAVPECAVATLCAQARAVARNIEGAA